MARKTKKRKAASKAVPKQAVPHAPTASAPPKEVGRRASFGVLGLYALGLAAVGGGGAAFAYDFMRTLGEHDLTKVGKGVPTIVQIHDPSCALCRSLQRETRTALKSFDADAVTYLVANIRSAEGAAFANRLGRGHVTLVLFDGAGTPVHTIEGVTPAHRLRAAFARYLSLTPEPAV